MHVCVSTKRVPVSRTGARLARLWLRLVIAREPELAAALLWLPDMERWSSRVSRAEPV